MFKFLKDFRWDKLKFDVTRLLGRLYYFNGALFWWIIDIIVFVAMGVKLETFLVSIPLAIITVIMTINWIRTLVYATLSQNTYSKLTDLLDRSNALQGVPGCGKTSTINQMGYVLAKKQWETLRYEYWQIRHLDFRLLSKKQQDKYNEIIRAYNFYKKYEETHIPCLHSFVTIEVKGRKSHSLLKGHMLQTIPLPYRSVWVGDEISSMFPNSVRGEDKKRNSKLAEQCRWIRHFTDSYALFADIRFGDAFLAIRSGCGCILTLEKKQKWILKPGFLIAVKKFFMSFVDYYYWLIGMTKDGSASQNKAKNSLRKSSKRMARFISWLNKLISCVGYREYYYSKSGSKEQGEEQIETTHGRYWFKSCLDVTYNDRAFKNLYSCKDEDFLEPDNVSIDMSKEELEKMLGRDE